MVSRDSRCLSAPPQQSTWNCKQNLLHVSCFPHLRNSEVGMHLSMLQTKLKCFQYCKLCTHNAALYRPLQRQTSQEDLAHRLTAVADLWSKQSWRGWCALLLRPGKVPCQVDLPGKKFRKRTAAAISSQKAEGSGRPAVRRRPSSKHPGTLVPKKRPLRRTPFTPNISNRLCRPRKAEGAGTDMA